MSSPMLHAFFVGRALAETVNQRAEHLLTDSLAWLGQFDAEQREHLRQLTEEVLARAQQAEATAGASPTPLLRPLASRLRTICRLPLTLCGRRWPRCGWPCSSTVRTRINPKIRCLMRLSHIPPVRSLSVRHL